MAFENDFKTLKSLNHELKKYKVKLSFQYYDVSPFNKKDIEVVDIVLKYSDILESCYNKIFILSSLGNIGFSKVVPYLVDLYFYFIKNVYSIPRDEIYLLHLCDTISKINSLEHRELYKKILCGPITQSAESIILMVSRYNSFEYDEIIFNLIKKENLIPNLWIGELNEDCKYWCSFIALKCIVSKKEKKYLNFFKSIIDSKSLEWLNFSESKYSKKLTLEWNEKYKKLANQGYNMLVSSSD